MIRAALSSIRPPPRLLAWAFLMLGWAFLYVASAWFTQVLSLSPGAMPFYAPAGIALAALLTGGWRYLSAVVIGITSVTLLSFAESGKAFHFSHAYYTALIVTLTSAQAVLALGLLQGFKLFKRSDISAAKAQASYSMRRWLLASAIAAPLGGLAQSLSVLFSGRIHPDFFAYTCWVATIGNFLGVLLITPALLAVRRGSCSWKHQVQAIALPLFLALVSVLYFWQRTEHNEQVRWQEKVGAQLEELRQTLKTQWQMTQTALTATQALVRESLVRETLARENLSPSDLNKINTQVSQASLVSFSQAFLHELPGLKLLEWQAAGSLNADASAQAKSEAWLVIRRPLLHQQIVRGHLLAWLDVKEFLAAASSHPNLRGWAISVDDITAQPTRYLWGTALITAPAAPTTQWMPNAAESSLELAERRWLIRLTPPPSYLAQQRSVQTWWVLLIGAVGLAALQAFLWSLAGHSAAVEAQVQKRTEELRNSQAKLHRMLESPLVGISLWNAAGEIYQANDAFLRLIGYTREELEQHSIAILDITPKKLHTQDIERRERIVQGETVEPFEKEYVHRDGRLIPVMISAHLFDDGQSGVSFVFDISKQKQIQEELRRLNLTLEQRVELELEKNREKDLLILQQARLAAIGEMIGNIAHQWRQPLNTMSLLLENIRDAYYFGELDVASMDDLVNTGQAVVQKMSGTIDDFRNFFRLDRQKQVFGLQQCVERTLQLVSAAYQAGDIEARIDVDQDVQVLGFESEYSQVLLNLFTNARDAIRDHKIASGVVTVVIEKRGDYGAIIVADNGGGIPSLLLEKIFDPYFTTREQGTGIGLYMSKMIIENNMNGRIEARNAGGGAEFTVLVPVAKSEETAAQPQAGLRFNKHQIPHAVT